MNGTLQEIFLVNFKYIIIGIGIFCVLIISATFFVISRRKHREIRKRKKIRRLKGKLMLAINNVEEAGFSPPIFKKLNRYNSEVKLSFIMSGLVQNKNVDKIKLISGFEDSVILINESLCIINKDGVILGPGQRCELRDEEKVDIQLQDSSDAVTIQFFAN